MPDLPAPAETAVRALLASAVRHALVVAGTALVTRGIVDQGVVDGAIPTLVETIVGTLLVAGATGWAQLRAWLAHDHLTTLWLAVRMRPTVLPQAPLSVPIPPVAASLTPATAGQADGDGLAA